MMFRKLNLLLAGWCVIIGLLAPILHTVWVSFSPDSFLTPPTTVWTMKWYLIFLSDPRWTKAFLRSLLIAALSALLAVALGAPAALAARKMHRRTQRFVTACLMLPVWIPPAAMGFGLLPLTHSTGLWGSTLSMVLVHATLGLPIAFLFVRTTRLETLDDLEAAAMGLGADRFSVVTRITIPLLKPTLLAAGTAVSVLSLNESLVSIFLATPANETLPVVIWPQLRYAPSPIVAVASCVTAAVGASGMLIVLLSLSNTRGHRGNSQASAH
jgi:ABC-type spermidine/putrescine transport system permease subunit II